MVLDYDGFRVKIANRLQWAKRECYNDEKNCFGVMLLYLNGETLQDWHVQQLT